MLSNVIGLQAVAAYSNDGLTRVMLHCALVLLGFRLMLRPRRARVEFAFVVTVLM